MYPICLWSFPPTSLITTFLHFYYSSFHSLCFMPALVRNFFSKSDVSTWLDCSKSSKSRYFYGKFLKNAPFLHCDPYQHVSVTKYVFCVYALYELGSIVLCNYVNKDINSRSIHRSCSIRKSVLRNFAEFTGKYLCQSLFFNKIVGWGLQLYQKGDSGKGVFLWILRSF